MTVPKPPRPLGREGRRTWSRVWRSNGRWLDKTMDIDIVMVLCEAVDERAQVRQIVEADPENWRQRIALRTLDTEIRVTLASLGMDPQSRKTLTPQVAKDQGRLAELRAVRQVDAG